MTQFPDRRILTLPAVHPCSSISQTTLIHSLTALAADIAALRPADFPVLRPAVRESLRQLTILLLLFQDLRDRGPHLPRSAVLTLSDLHVTLQKLRHLLSDCSRRGARLWILMNSHRILPELRLLLRSIATALDVAPLSTADVNQEIKEMVELLATQAFKVKIDADPDDDRTAFAVRSILTQFEAGIAPERSELINIVTHLGIKSWADCSDEIAFLEKEEISEQSSLIGFMIYCRAVLFEVIKSNNRRKDFPELRETGLLHCLNPDGLRCPISLELMSDPVTISTGQTYNRPSIVQWLDAGHKTCPVTAEKLTSTDLVPNFATQRIIRQYCQYNNIPFAEPGNNNSSSKNREQRDQSKAAVAAISMTAAFLVAKLSAGTGEEKNRAAYEIRTLSKSSNFHRACLVEADSVPWLLHLLSSSDSSSQENAVSALLNLSKHPSGRAAIFEIGGLSLVVDVMTKGLKTEAQQNAAAIIFYLSSVDEYRRAIGEIPEAIPALVNLLRRGTYRGKKNAVVALFGLLLSPRNHPRVLAAGATTALFDLLTDGREDLVTDCIGVLAKIAERQEGTREILESSSQVLPLLVHVLQSSTSRSGREYCVCLMLSLCSNGGTKAVRVLEKLPLLMPSLYSLLTGGSPQASKKARSLINRIHQIHDQDYPAIATTSPIQDHFVHAL